MKVYEQCLRVLQSVIVAVVRPYIVREWFGWGRVYAVLVGDYQRDWLWAGAPIKTMKGKIHGYVMHLNLSMWPDRSTYFLGRWHDLEMQLLQRALIRRGDTIVDIGAHRGDFALVGARLVEDEGKVICFEPNLICLDLLDREIAANQIENVIVHRVGLGDRDEELRQDPSSLAVVLTQTNRAFEPAVDALTTVKIKKGDDLLKGECPVFIKIDVEGFECKVLSGLANTIQQHHPVVVTEVVPRHLSACGYSVDDIIRIMRGHGYNGYRLGLRKKRGRYTWELSPLDIEARDYDAVWIHPAYYRNHLKLIDEHIRKIQQRIEVRCAK